MAFLGGIGTVLDRVVPTVIGFGTGGPLGAVTAAVGVEQAKKNEKIMERNMAYLGDPGIDPSRFTSTIPIQSRTNNASFFGNLGQTIGGFGRDVGGFLQDISPALNLFGIGGQRQQMAPQAAKTIDIGKPQETAQSGEILGANIGLGANLIGGAARFIRSPGGQAALGFGAGAVGAALSGGANGAPRITRRMKSDVRRVYNMSMGNPDITAQILNQMGTYPRIDFDAATVFFILTKRFRNDGPVVTKAAVRKTKTTLRRMKGVVDMYNSVCKPTTRRAPARRAAPKAVQLIKN